MSLKDVADSMCDYEQTRCCLTAGCVSACGAGAYYQGYVALFMLPVVTGNMIALWQIHAQEGPIHAFRAIRLLQKENNQLSYTNAKLLRTIAELQQTRIISMN